MGVERWFVFAWAVLVGIHFLRWGIEAASERGTGDDPRSAHDGSERERIRRADDARELRSPVARYAVAGLGFAMAGALLAGVVPAAVAYALLCLALVGRCIADQIAEERAPRRRSTVLGRSRRLDPVLMVWIVLAVGSSLSVVPYVLGGPDRTTALVVAACVVVMAIVAWRIASAPPLLSGDDLEAEQIVDRETRALRTGNTCVVMVATSSTFIGLEGDFRMPATLTVFVAIFIWKSLYARQLSRTPIAS